MLRKYDKKEFGSAFRLAASVKGILLFVSFLLNVIVLFLLKSDLFDSFVYNMSNYDNWGGLLFNFAAMWLSVLCPVLLFFALKKKGWFRSEVFSKRPALTEVGTAVGYSVIFTYVAQIVGILLIETVLSLFGKSLPNDEVANPTNFGMILFMCVVVAVTPALFEEFCVRGAVLSVLKRYGVGFASVISAFVFMMLHNTLAQLPLAFAAGLCFAFCSFKFRSIWPAVIAHFTVNLNSCLLSLILSMPEGNLRGFVFICYFFFFFITIGSLALMGLIVHGFRLPAYEKPTPEIKKTRIRFLFTTPSVYIFFGLFLCMLTYNILSIFLV